MTNIKIPVSPSAVPASVAAAAPAAPGLMTIPGIQKIEKSQGRVCACVCMRCVCVTTTANRSKSTERLEEKETQRC